MRTPVSIGAIQEANRKPADVAVIDAWVEPGRHPEWHAAARARVRAEMPLLALALDRLACTRSRTIPARIHSIRLYRLPDSVWGWQCRCGASEAGYMKKIYAEIEASEHVLQPETPS